MNNINNPVLFDIWKDRYCKNNETLEENYRRVANYIANDKEEEEEFYHVISEGLFLPAGRTMSNAGIGKNLTMNNCFVYPIVGDSMEEIFEAVKSGALTHKAGGGIGYEFSLIRPNGTPTSNDAVASGVVSFMDVFNAQTATVMQGSRRGANMGVLSIYHPDIEDFITAKSSDKNRLNHFNLSIMVDDNFMNAVKNKEKIYLHYPVYDEKYHIITDNSRWSQSKEIDANYLWDKIMHSAYDNGEPGIMFYDNLNKNNNTWYTETITHSNPCFEYLAGTVFGQNLSSNNYAGACNLGSILLHNFVKEPFTEKAYLDFTALSATIRTAVKILDNIIDINIFPLSQYENYQKGFRTIGLGVTGLADMLAMLGLKYNSKEAIEYVDNLMEMIAIAAYSYSIKLAKIKGSFPFLKSNKYIQSGYIQKHLKGKNKEAWQEIIEDILKYGIRNARLLAVAPCGTLSLTFGNNCSSGIEPIFSLGYDRKIMIGGQNDEDAKIVHISDYAYDIYKNKNDKNYDDVFVTALNMTVNEHVDMLSVIAKHIDMSVSKTINVPTDYSFEDTKNIYFRCWQEGIKGCTIFRPNELRQGVLITEENKKEESKKESKTPIFDSIMPISRKQLGTTHGNTYCKHCACGTLYITVNSDNHNNVVETFIESSKGGICKANTAAVNRMISLALRSGVKVDEVIDQLQGIYCPACMKTHKSVDGISCPDIMAKTLKEFYNSKKTRIIEEIPPIFEEKTKNEDKCPECGSPIRREGGCVICNECGWSKCG